MAFCPKNLSYSISKCWKWGHEQIKIHGDRHLHTVHPSLLGWTHTKMGFWRKISLHPAQKAQHTVLPAKCLLPNRWLVLPAQIIWRSGKLNVSPLPFPSALSVYWQHLLITYLLLIIYILRWSSQAVMATMLLMTAHKDIWLRARDPCNDSQSLELLFDWLFYLGINYKF